MSVTFSTEITVAALVAAIDDDRDAWQILTAADQLATTGGVGVDAVYADAAAADQLAKVRRFGEITLTAEAAGLIYRNFRGQGLEVRGVA